MVDGALETLDLTLSKRGIVGFASSFFVDDSDSFSIFFNFFNFFSTDFFVDDCEGFSIFSLFLKFSEIFLDKCGDWFFLLK